MKLQSLIFTLLSFLIAIPAVHAQFNIPFRINLDDDFGFLDAFPTPTMPTGTHTIPGNATFGDLTLDYNSVGTAIVLGVTPPVPFESAQDPNLNVPIPTIFDFGNGDTLAMVYGRTDFGAQEQGVATIEPADPQDPNAGLNVTWLAEFNPVPGLSTGIFENVTGGSFIMTAIMEGVDISQPNIPVRWFSDQGALTVVPEPSAWLLCLPLAAIAIFYKRRSH